MIASKHLYFFFNHRSIMERVNANISHLKSPTEVTSGRLSLQFQAIPTTWRIVRYAWHLVLPGSMTKCNKNIPNKDIGYRSEMFTLWSRNELWILFLLLTIQLWLMANNPWTFCHMLGEAPPPSFPHPQRTYPHRKAAKIQCTFISFICKSTFLSLEIPIFYRFFFSCLQCLDWPNIRENILEL